MGIHSKLQKTFRSPRTTSLICSITTASATASLWLPTGCQSLPQRTRRGIGRCRHGHIPLTRCCLLPWNPISCPTALAQTNLVSHCQTMIPSIGLLKLVDVIAGLGCIPVASSTMCKHARSCKFGCIIIYNLYSKSATIRLNLSYIMQAKVNMQNLILLWDWM